MIALKQSLSDGILLIKTDRRIWAAGGFLCFVMFIWSVTSVWRPPELEPAPERRVKPDDAPPLDLIIADFHKDLAQTKKGREELREVINRTANELQNDKEKIDWHMNTLTDRLNAMTMRVDKLVQNIGTRKVDDAKLEERLKANQKKGRQKKRVDYD